MWALTHCSLQALGGNLRSMWAYYIDPNVEIKHLNAHTQTYCIGPFPET